MKQTALLLSLFLVAISSVSAQRINFKVGGGLASHYDGNARSIGALKLGASYEHELSGNFSIEPGAYFYVKGYEDKVFAIFDGIPGQLSRKEKKYRLSSLGKQARFRTYEDSFVWLNEAMVVNTCFNATDPHVGLALSADNATQKCYMADTGLLVTHAFPDGKYTDNELYRAILFDKLDINEGMLMENIVAQMFRLRRPRLYFYSRSDNRHRENNMEIDFLIAEGKRIAPVEVKSSCYRYHSSLDKFRKRFPSVIGNSYILYTKDVMLKDGIIHLPLYMAELL